MFRASKHHEMARYDLPTYVLYVSGHFWMFAVQMCIFTKNFRTFDPHLPIVLVACLIFNVSFRKLMLGGGADYNG